MRKLAFIMLGALWCVAALGQDLLACVDPDVLRGLIFRADTAEGTLLSAEKPDEMSKITPPGQFSWIGSSERSFGAINGSPLTTVTTAFKTDLSPAAALSTAAAGLTNDGWEAQPELTLGGGAPVLVDYLAGQMNAQGWSFDAKWSGTLSSGASWIRQGTDGTSFWSTVEIVSLGDDTYAVHLTLLTAPL